MTANDPRLGPNSWLVEEMYDRWRANPEAVDLSWRNLFEQEGGSAIVEFDPPADEIDLFLDEPGFVETSSTERTAPELPTANPAVASSEPESAPSPDEPGRPLRGVGALIARNMEASLAVPTATSYRRVPAKLLELNRRLINDHLAKMLRGKVSFTHLLAYAVVRALDEVPAMTTTFVQGTDGSPRVLGHDELGLGIAVDVERPDGTRSLMVPCIRGANLLSFQDFFDSYEGLVARVRANRLTADELAGVTLSITNVGTLGTVQSVPRLMPGQSAIVGLGAIGFPAEYEGADPRVLADLGLSATVTVSNTYDHRVIQGAESGEFLRAVHRLVLGESGFYDRIFESLGVPHQPVRWLQDDNPADKDRGYARKQMQVRKLIQMYRVRGHLIADLDPLSLAPRTMHPELDPASYGLTVWDLDREFLTDDVPGADVMTLGDILGTLREAYCGTVGVEYMHIQDPAEREWLQQRLEVRHERPSESDRRHILERISAAEAFERFLHQRYVGHKRFGLEGGESAIAILDAILEASADAGMARVVLGMAHRGRLNVLSNVMGQGYDRLFRQFEGQVDPNTIQGSGDVKYHVGAETTFVARSGNGMPLQLAANPSHLEAVDPVVHGMVRAYQDVTEPAGSFRVLPLVVHGDAAFAGQGVVAETLNLSNIPGYRVGGTVHVIINNQVGYTTPPGQARSSVYATDVAKTVQAPVFHVNGDDPEACVRVARMAFEFRQRFAKDVVVDMVCYRRHGHNEGDDPSYTQPLMYDRIRTKRTVRELYTEMLVRRGDISPEEASAELDAFEAGLQQVLDETRSATSATPPSVGPPARFVPSFDPVATGVEREVLERVNDALVTLPPGFTLHPKLARQFEARGQLFASGYADWGLAELMAYGSIMLEGRPVRLCGQDTRRGTFAHRHAVLVDRHDESEYFPLRHIDPVQGSFFIYDSMLSEYAAMGVEYGYSVVRRDGLVAWEAQFGDFVNGAQIIIDQFLAASQDKWGQHSGLTLLLPHGYEGQGPEHSSARIERFLILCAGGNLAVVHPTTAAQFFHLLRRQVLTGNRQPLVVFTPKSLLRSANSRSPVEELVSGWFRETLDDPDPRVDPERVRRIVLCSGKVAFDAIAARDARAATDTAVIRIEQLYPWPDAQLRDLLARYRADAEVVWLQEEPSNMGPWSFVRSRIDDLVGATRRVQLVGRPESGSPACGSMAVHQQELAGLLDGLLS